MTWDEEYAEFVRDSERGKTGLGYALQKLPCEGGEALQYYAEAERKGAEPDLAAIALELGDTLWSVISACNHMGITLADVAEINKMKLTRRRAGVREPKAEHEQAEVMMRRPRLNDGFGACVHCGDQTRHFSGHPGNGRRCCRAPECRAKEHG